MKRFLEPEPNLQFRLTVLGVLLIPVLIVLITRGSIIIALLASIFPVMLTGTYRVSKISGEKFFTRMYVGFVPFSRERCKLPGVVYIHTSYEHAQAGCLTLILFGPLQWVFGHIFDQLIPSVGGPYEIWLESAKRGEIMAWKGHNQQQFERNLELLRNHTGAEVRLR